MSEIEVNQGELATDSDEKIVYDICSSLSQKQFDKVVDRYSRDYAIS